MEQVPAAHLGGGHLPSQSPAPIAQRRLIVFEGGVPVLKDVPLMTPAVVRDLHTASLAELYAEPEDLLAAELGLPTSEFYGRPLLEVMLIRRARHAAYTGNFVEVESILDRELGKPKTTSENTNVTVSYEQALKNIAEKERLRAAAAAAVPAEIVTREPWEDLI